MDKTIDSRLPIDASVEPVQIKEQDFFALDRLRESAEELDDLRKEMGRLYQVMNNIRMKADSVESDLNGKRRELLSGYGITEGSWVIDFPSKTLVKLDKKAPAPV